MIAVMWSITARTAGERPTSRWNSSHSSWVSGGNRVGHADQLGDAARHDAGQDGKAQPRAGRRQKVGEVVGSERKSAIARPAFSANAAAADDRDCRRSRENHGHPRRTGRDSRATHRARKRHDRQSPRDHPFLVRSSRPYRQVGFTLAKTDLAGLADQLDAQAGVLCLKRQEARREKLGRNVGGALTRTTRSGKRPTPLAKRAISAMPVSIVSGAIANLLAFGRQAPRARQAFDHADAEIAVRACRCAAPRWNGRPAVSRTRATGCRFRPARERISDCSSPCSLANKRPPLRRNSRSANGGAVSR